MGVDLLKAANESFPAMNALMMHCRRCTFEHLYDGDTDAECCRNAINAGWRKSGDKYICPKCAKRYGL